jgi:hypothetical protein
MLLIDLSQVIIANLMVNVKLLKGKGTLDEGLFRHMALNALRSNILQFKSKYPEVVICCDGKKYWRQEVFQFYKANRKKDRDESDLDWNLIFDYMSKFREELKENFIHPVIEVEGAEADDIIAVLTARYSPHKDILILSSDKDFLQLQKYRNVQQYSPNLKRFIRTDDPGMFLREHILRGDRRDGVPNFLSADNVLVTGTRQKRIMTEKLVNWVKDDPSTFLTTKELEDNYKRNKTMVDLDCIPEKITKKIVDTYEATKKKSRSQFLNYLIDKKLVNLIEVADEF